MITIAPVVADARFPIHDQRVDTQLREARGGRKPGLSTADNEHGRLTVGIFGGGVPQVEPIGTAKIARIGLALRTRSPVLFLEPLEFVERREQRPCFERVAVVAIGGEPQDSATATVRGFKPKDRLDRVGARAHDVAGRSPIGSDPETGRSGAADTRFQLSQNGVRAVHRFDVPGKRQHIAPMAVGMKQRVEQTVVGLYKGPFELREPIPRSGRGGFCFCLCQHSRPPFDLRGVSRIFNLRRLRPASER